MWVFGYGSLMWDNWEKEFDGKRYDHSKLQNHRRDFNKKSTRNWGTSLKPGPTLGLEYEFGSECIGCAFEFSDDKREQITEYLKSREGRSASLSEIDTVLSDGKTVKALATIISREANTYIGKLSLSQRAKMAKSAAGIDGKCVDYVANIRNQLSELKIVDTQVEGFWKALQDA